MAIVSSATVASGSVVSETRKPIFNSLNDFFIFYNTETNALDVSKLTPDLAVSMSEYLAIYSCLKKNGKGALNVGALRHYEGTFEIYYGEANLVVLFMEFEDGHALSSYCLLNKSDFSVIEKI
jgi:hypothetical protein